ncbi:hypothetical protein F6X51_05935 [Methylobacterium planeticum]|uniref:Uncharacterized protein n=1 Tax=Methylobacterium planeticum TaxID=2615211 RepID=A0A6N6MXD3_9HYPH|nr:hypothetical protein F6X51_05935 [Methylobacterium planeticum]
MESEPALIVRATDLETTTDLGTLIASTRTPALRPRVTFGKHSGRQWSARSDDFIAWVLAHGGFAVDIRFAARHDRRLAPGATPARSPCASRSGV